MEKQASKLNQQNSNIFKAIIFTFLLTLVALPTKAQVLNDSTAVVKKDTITVQENIVYEKGKEYVLGGISISGLQKFSESTVKVFTGLKIGQPIKLPGDKLTSAIKKLYESKQFSNVDVYLEKLDDNTVYLQFFVQELPQLNTVKITGVKKGKAKELLKDAELKQGAMVTDNLVVTSRNYFTKKYTDKGFLKTKVSLNVKQDTTDINTVNMAIFIDKGKKIKIKNILFLKKHLFLLYLSFLKLISS